MKNKIIAFDLDDVICHRASNTGDIEKYKSCQPNKNMVKVVNKIYDSGNTVIIYTARGMTTQKGNIHNIYSKLYELTIRQLNSWGVKYHQLAMGKLHYDLLVDDKAINSLKIKTARDVENFFGGDK